MKAVYACRKNLQCRDLQICFDPHFLYLLFSMYICEKKIAAEIYSELQKKIVELEKKPTLGAILVGNNSESLRYIGQKRKFAEQIGMHFELLHLPETISQKTLLSHIEAWNHSPDISGKNNVIMKVLLILFSL